MAIKTFTDNTTLPASDINTYLTNSGLVYITQASATTGSTLSISNCFTGGFDAYRVVIDRYTNSSAAALDVQLQVSGTPTTAGYYYVYVSSSYVTTATYSQIGAANTTAWTPMAITGGADSGASAFDLFNPKITNRTIIAGTRTDPRPSGAVGSMNGYLDNATAYDGIKFTSNAGTLSLLRVTVYGYRVA
jgi:hypothetical protein